MRTLYGNGRVYSTAAASAFLVEDARIAWLGSDDEARQLTGVRRIDLGGSLVTPAFVDAHVHCTSAGIALSGLDLAATASLAEALALVERAARAGRGRPVIGGGWDETRWPEQRPPTATELDRAGYGGLVYLARVDVHSAVVSSQLLETVRELPGFGSDGQVRSAAHDRARVAALAALTPAQTTELQRVALTHAASLGIACVTEMAGPAISSPADLTGLLALASSEPLPEVIPYWGELHGIETARELGAVGAAGDLFCDGSIGSHTAAMSEPYRDRPETSGELVHDTAELIEHIVGCAEAGLHAGFHAIGDAAVDQVLTAFELASERVGRPAGAQSRIEHAEFVRDPARLAASGLVASMQPLFDAEWGGSDGMYATRLGPQRATALNRFADLAAAGVPLAFGSDAPVTPLGPWAAIRAATTMHDPATAVSVEAAFAAHTAGGWQAARRPETGRLAVGEPATFAVWTTPSAGLPTLAGADELPRCLATVRTGTAIFDTGLLAG